MTATFLPALAAAALPASLGPAWAEFSSDPQLFSVETRVEIGTRGYDSERRQLDFWMRRTVTTRDVPVVTWAESRSCPAVWDVLARMRDLPVPRFAPMGVTRGPQLPMDGTIFALRTYSDGGEIVVQTNEGTPLAEWVEASLAILEPCWGSTIPQRTS